MAFDKVVDSTKLFAGMTATANAIREKTGSTDPIVWDSDNGFKTAVEGIEAGGGGEEWFYSDNGLPYKRNMEFIGDYTGKKMELTWGNPKYLESVDFGTFTLMDELKMRGEFLSLKHINAPRITVFQRCFWFSNNPNMESVTLGSIGYPVTEISTGCFFYGVGNAIITVYVDATALANIVSKVSGSSPWGAKNATIIYRNSTTGEVITE